jgi:hypothetical protein
MGIEDPESQTKASLWHTRLGHQGHKVLEEINTKFNLSISKSDLAKIRDKLCTICTQGKSIRKAIHSEADPQYKATEALQCLHADLVGPVTVVVKKNHPRCPSLGGHLYALIVTDEATHTVFVILLKLKSEAEAALISLIKQLQLRTGRTVERFHGDGGGEFISSAFRIFLKENGTRFTHTTADTPSHNGIAERMNRTLFEIMRTLLIQASAPEAMWGEALDWAAHLYNVTPHPVSNNMAPFKLLYNYSYNIQKLRVWGCDAYVQVLPDKKSKVQPRTWTGVFVGFNSVTAAYKIMNPITKAIASSNDVHFDEHSFSQLKKLVIPKDRASSTSIHVNPFSVLGEQLEDNELVENGSLTSVQESAGDTVMNDNSAVTDSPNEIEVVEEDENKFASFDESESEDDDSIMEFKYDSEPDATKEENQSPLNEKEPKLPPIKLTREAKGLLNQFNSWNQRHIQSERPRDDTTTTRSGREVLYPSERTISSDPTAYAPTDMHDALTRRITEHANVATVEAIINDEPKQYRDAINSSEAPEWNLAMKDEINSMIRLGVWSIVPCPKDVKPLKGRWVFKNKLGDNNQIIRRKARFVAKGFLQIYGRDFFETHAPVAKMKSIKLMLSLTAQQDLELFQLDFDTAFLNAPVEEDIYLEQPEGFHIGASNMVCKLIKAIYGLKQAPRNWNQTIDTFMRQLGYRALLSDPCVYIKTSKTGRLIILSLYVDDTVIAFHQADLAEWTADKESIAASYAIKDLGECHWILNMKLTRNRLNRTITLSQEAYVERILTQYGMDQVRISNIPARVEDLYMPPDGTTKELLSSDQAIEYQKMVGSLLYAANITRIDIAFIVSQLCRYTAKPYKHHLEAAKQVFRYLRDTTSSCLIFGQSRPDPGEINVTAYADASGGDKQTGKCTSGCVVRFNGDVINWFSRKQKSVAQSSAESEYMALAEAVKEVLWYRSWIYEVLNQRICCIIKCDNQAAMALSENDTIHDRSKHIGIRYHLIRDNVNKRRVRLSWVPTQEQQADILTKALGPQVFIRLRDLLLTW